MYIALRFILPWNFRAWLYHTATSQPQIFARLLVGKNIPLFALGSIL